MSGSNCCFLTCIEISEEEGKVVWYSHLLKNFPQFVVIHIVKGFGIVSKAEVDVFLELLEKEKVTYSSILAWRIPWTVESMGLQRVGHNWVIYTPSFVIMISFLRLGTQQAPKNITLK